MRRLAVLEAECDEAWQNGHGSRQASSCKAACWSSSFDLVGRSRTACGEPAAVRADFLLERRGFQTGPGRLTVVFEGGGLSLKFGCAQSHVPMVHAPKGIRLHEASNTIWSYCQRRSKKLKARRSKSRSWDPICRISPSARFPSMARSSRSSKESTVRMRSVDVCDRLISTATLPGGRRSRTHTVHGKRIGM
jgi:hypothetical protein